MRVGLTLGPGAEGFDGLGHGESVAEVDEVDLTKQGKISKQNSSKMAAERQRTEFTWRKARSMIYELTYIGYYSIIWDLNRFLKV